MAQVNEETPMVQYISDAAAMAHLVRAVTVEPLTQTEIKTPKKHALAEISLPRVSLHQKLVDLTRFFVTRARVELGGTALHPTPRKRRPLSDTGLFVFRYADPLFTWWGHNTRTLVSPSLGVVAVQDEAGIQSLLVNGASHNYAGFYEPAPEAKELHQSLISSLPIMCADNSQPRVLMHQAIADFCETDFCVSTSTGYGSNLLALPAILGQKRTGIFIDCHCHNSMFTGCFLSPTASISKFKHNDMKHLASLLRNKVWEYDHVVVAIEGLYSMEGDTPPLGELHRLKLKYGFDIVCDEAHSFLTLGASGRGCLELWNMNHPEDPVPIDLIDLRTATLSKSVGGIGGIVVGKKKFQDAVMRRYALHENNELTSLLTATAFQTLLVLQQPERTRSNLDYLSQVARFCRKELKRARVFVYGDDDTPILPVWAGGPGAASRLSYKMRLAGLLATPVSAPAVPYWESRVRVNLSAAYRACDVDQLIRAIVSAVKACGISNPGKSYSPCLFHPAFKPGTNTDKTESAKAVDTLQEMAQYAAPFTGSETRAAVGLQQMARICASQSQYGIGSGSSRWISGTFTSHLAVEDSISRMTAADAALTYPDSAIGMASTMAALMRPLRGCKSHKVLLPWKVARSVHDGLVLANLAKKGSVSTTCTYQDVFAVPDDMRQQSAKSKTSRACYTVFICVHDDGDAQRGKCHDQCPGLPLSAVDVFLAVLSSATSELGCDVTVLLRLPVVLQQLGPLKAMATKHARNLHILWFGSFFETLGFPGGFVAGSRELIDELRYTSRGYMYTTSPPPFVMEMAFCRLKEAAHGVDA